VDAVWLEPGCGIGKGPLAIEHVGVEIADGHVAERAGEHALPCAFENVTT
jgi:hypothetical protein